jgi:hypothetical protein
MNAIIKFDDKSKGRDALFKAGGHANSRDRINGPNFNNWFFDSELNVVKQGKENYTNMVKKFDENTVGIFKQLEIQNEKYRKGGNNKKIIDKKVFLSRETDKGNSPTFEKIFTMSRDFFEKLGVVYIYGEEDSNLANEFRKVLRMEISDEALENIGE